MRVDICMMEARKMGNNFEDEGYDECSCGLNGNVQNVDCVKCFKNPQIRISFRGIV
jgi:hypothetical protein